MRSFIILSFVFCFMVLEKDHILELWFKKITEIDCNLWENAFTTVLKKCLTSSCLKNLDIQEFTSCPLVWIPTNNSMCNISVQNAIVDTAGNIN
jgi:hypothetical protein